MPEKPAWLSEFAENVCACLHAIDQMPPIGCHFARDRETWEVTLFISPTEIVGGEYDGERLSCLFSVDTLELMHLFDIVESATWQAHQMSDSDELGPHYAVAGYCQGRRISLRLLADTPARFAPGRFANVLEQRLVETWEA